MTILSGDIKFLASKVMSDDPEGGGGPVGVVIQDGDSNAIFQDITEFDRAGGAVSIRQAFLAVQTPNKDTLMDANLIVSELPNDPNVSVTLAKCQMFSVRTEIANSIENYLIKGPQWGGYLLENHVAGQRSIQLFQRVGSPTPPIGRTLALIYDEGSPTEIVQYVRVTKVQTETRTFTSESGGAPVDYKADVVTCDLSDALRYSFRGSAPSRGYSRSSNTTVVRDTTVADAATYYGASELKNAAVIGDLSAKVDTVYSQLVPSARTEVPLVQLRPYNASGAPVAGATPVSYSTSATWSSATALSLPGGCLPSSLEIVTGGVVIFDEAGLLRTSSGAVGAIDYGNGILTLSSGSFAGAKVITYTPAATVLRVPQSTGLTVTSENRGQTYVGTITPVPSPGTLSINYMALGNWYVLNEQSDGTISGLDPLYGAGTFDSTSGAFLITLGALPDVGSSIILVWGASTQEEDLVSTVLPIAQDIPLTPPVGVDVQPGSLSLTWENSGTKTATVAVDGTLTGDATGKVKTGGVVSFSPTTMPPIGTLISASYNTGTKDEEVFLSPSPDGSGNMNVTAAGTLSPGSVEVEWRTYVETTPLGLNAYDKAQISTMSSAGAVAWENLTQRARDDGLGNIKLNGVTIGTVNYGTGAIMFNPKVSVQVPVPQYRVTAPPTWSMADTYNARRLVYAGVELKTFLSYFQLGVDSYIAVRYNSTSGAGLITRDVVFAPKVQLLSGTAAQVLPGSVVLRTSSSALLADNGDGVLREIVAGVSTSRGAVNYFSGEVSLTWWVVGSAASITREACVTTFGENISSEFVFRTAAAPIRPGSLSILYARATGGTQTVSADAGGVISASGIEGTVDHQTGVVNLSFGEFVTAVGNEGEPWYAVAKVNPVTGLIFRPDAVASSSIKYSAVAYSYLPIDSDILGLDPVRLPQDGRVPIYRKGSYVVVGHSASTTQTVTNSSVINVGRERLSRVRVSGADGVVLNTGYSADLDAGIVTFTDVSTYVQPVTITNRVEDLLRTSDVQINGDLTFTRQLSHNFPVGSVVSSALIAGDLKARVSHLFDQATWNGTTWKDSTEGAAAVGTYNDAVAPLVVTNEGALTERWLLRFTNTSNFECIGEHVGVIGTSDKNVDFSPINPITGTPYFTIKALGWGTGWATGNILRINTVGAMVSFAAIRTVQSGVAAGTDYKFELLARGDVDRPPGGP